MAGFLMLCHSITNLEIQEDITERFFPNNLKSASLCTRTAADKCYYSGIHDKITCKLSSKAFEESKKSFQKKRY